MNQLTKLTEEMSSREIAELTGKRHPDVKRDIVKVAKEFGLDVSKMRFIYIDSMNRQQTEYKITGSALNAILNRRKYRLSCHGQREGAALNAIEQLLGIALIRQFRVGSYRIDGYHKESNTAYEIDEPAHFIGGELKPECVTRQQEIERELKCKFVRIKV